MRSGFLQNLRMDFRRISYIDLRNTTLAPTFKWPWKLWDVWRF